MALTPISVQNCFTGNSRDTHLRDATIPKATSKHVEVSLKDSHWRRVAKFQHTWDSTKFDFTMFFLERNPIGLATLAIVSRNSHSHSLIFTLNKPNKWFQRDDFHWHPWFPYFFSPMVTILKIRNRPQQGENGASASGLQLYGVKLPKGGASSPRRIHPSWGISD